ncbi:hypothetical protein FKP32DRAFT_1680066 [Trametes sanguinea]|nr:hypothetical protein FKP32DRAFT_1680066 [Trametes sanguinea]
MSLRQLRAARPRRILVSSPTFLWRAWARRRSPTERGRAANAEDQADWGFASPFAVSYAFAKASVLVYACLDGVPIWTPDRPLRARRYGGTLRPSRGREDGAAFGRGNLLPGAIGPVQRERPSNSAPL